MCVVCLRAMPSNNRSFTPPSSPSQQHLCSTIMPSGSHCSNRRYAHAVTAISIPGASRHKPSSRTREHPRRYKANTDTNQTAVETQTTFSVQRSEPNWPALSGTDACDVYLPTHIITTWARYTQSISRGGSAQKLIYSFRSIMKCSRLGFFVACVCVCLVWGVSIACAICDYANSARCYIIYICYTLYAIFDMCVRVWSPRPRSQIESGSKWCFRVNRGELWLKLSCFKLRVFWDNR